MKVLFDSNVIIDAMTDREGAVSAERMLLLSATEGAFEGVIAAKQITDIYYVLRKYVPEKERRLAFIRILLNAFEVVSTERIDLFEALMLDQRDYEDAVLVVAAKKAGADFILTNNVSDFSDCDFPAKTPVQALSALGLDK